MVDAEEDWHVPLGNEEEAALDWEDLFGENGDIRKCVLREGCGAAPQYEQAATVRYSGRVVPAAGASRAAFVGPRTMTTFVGSGDLVPGLELAVRHMRVGERALVRCSQKFGYGPGGRAGNAAGTGAVPADAAL